MQNPRGVKVPSVQDTSRIFPEILGWSGISGRLHKTRLGLCGNIPDLNIPRLLLSLVLLYRKDLAGWCEGATEAGWLRKLGNVRRWHRSNAAL